MGDEGRVQLLEHYLRAVPLPDGVTSRDLVRSAVEFRGPARIPYSFFDPFESDFCELSVAQFLLGLDEQRVKGPRERGSRYRDEWGVTWEVTGRSWDHAVEPPLADLSRLDGYELPDVTAPERFAPLAPWVGQAVEAGKYVVGYDPVGMFERMRGLLGFEDLMLAHYTQRDRLEVLLDRLTDLSVAAIERWAAIGGVDAYMTWEDWGLQTTLQMKVETFREVYEPRYARIVEAAHDHGMHYFWHCCGQILDLLPRMVELGVDVVQLDQPRLMGHDVLADAFGGRIGFWNTVDIQWSTGEVTDDELRDEVGDMVAAFDRLGGGFLARHYPQGADIALSHHRHRVIYDAFMAHGCSLDGR